MSILRRGNISLVLALAAVVAATGGALVYWKVSHRGAGDARPDSTQQPTSSNEKAKSFSEPQLLIVSYRKGQTILAIDFDSTKALDKNVSMEDRKQFVLQESLRIFEKERSGLRKDTAKVRIHALAVPDRDEYAKGSFRNMQELATMDSTLAQLGNGKLSMAERAGVIVWKSGMDKAR